MSGRTPSQPSVMRWRSTLITGPTASDHPRHFLRPRLRYRRHPGLRECQARRRSGKLVGRERIGYETHGNLAPTIVFSC
jgi:hypothetical protein